MVTHAYAQDLRDRVLGALERGEGPTVIAKRYEVSRLWVHQARTQWIEGEPRWDCRHLAFLDETATAINMTRQRGRSPHGQRGVASVSPWPLERHLYRWSASRCHHRSAGIGRPDERRRVSRLYRN